MTVFNTPITVTHNGMHVEFFNNDSEVLDFISKTISHNANLKPQLVVDNNINGDMILIVYQYSTIYKEMFLIEIEEDF